MQKKLIALAVASALTMPAVALADTGNVTIYGSANVSYDFVNAGALGTSSQRVSSNQSTLGLKGSEDLGGGLTAVWQVESMVDITGASTGYGGSTLATRNTFVGLSSGSLGTIVLGRHDTPYKIATRGLDVFADGIADNRSLMGQSSSSLALPATNGVTAFDGRQPDVIAYISPAMAGLTVAIGHVNLNQALGLNQSVSPAHNSGAWSVAGLYGNGPFFASLAYEKHDLEAALPVVLPALFPTAASAVGKEEKAYKLGLGYTQDAFNVGLVYEKSSDNLGAGGANLLGRKAWYVGGKYNVSGTDAVKMGYAKTGDLGAAVNTGANQWSLGYDHGMSKRTTVYALYTKLNNNAGAMYGLSGNASGANTANPAGGTLGATGSDPSAFSVGLKHTF